MKDKFITIYRSKDIPVDTTAVGDIFTQHYYFGYKIFY